MISALKRALPWVNGLLAFMVWRLGWFMFRGTVAVDRPSWGRVCVIQVNAIGDVLMVTPLLQALVDQLGPGQVDVVVNRRVENLLQAFPGLGIIHPVDSHLRWRNPSSVLAFARLVRFLRSQRYAAVLDAARLTQSAWLTFLSRAQWRIGLRLPRHLGPVRIIGWDYLYTHEVTTDPDTHMIRQNLALLRPLGVDSPSERMRLFPTETDRETAAAWLSAHNLCPPCPFAVIHPGAKWPPKRWHADRFAQVARRLAAIGLTPVVVGAAGERRVLATVAAGPATPTRVISGELSLGALGALIERAALFVGNDSGLSHMAAAVGTPVVAIFGPTLPERTGPLAGGDHTVIQPISCRPCRLYFTRDQCERGHNYCMDLIEVEQVWAAIQSALSSHFARSPAGGSV